MRLKTFRHLWGVYEAWDSVFPKIKADGYDGIEAVLPSPEREKEFTSLMNQHGFEYIPQIFTNGANVDAHVESFKKQVDRCKQLNAIQITVHSGRDAWTRDQAEAFYKQALAIERSAGIAVAHETHRGRFFYQPWNTRDMVERFDELKLCCDFSHWCVVLERVMDDCDDIIQLCAKRCIHIHSRVGYEEGPQVTDPSAPEWKDHLAFHEKWWDWIWDAQKARGMAASTLTPEFGPPKYLHTLPFTNVPVANLWNVCNWIAKRQRERFAAR